MPILKKQATRLFIAFLILTGGYFGISLVGQVMTGRDINAQVAAYATRNAESAATLTAQNAKLSVYQTPTTYNQYVANAARNELGYILPGETPIIIVAGTPLPVTPTAEKQAEPRPPGKHMIWQEWVDLLRHHQ